MNRSDSPAPSGASPIKAFLIILALIILTTVIFLMAANGEEPPRTAETQSNPPPDFFLTDEEALARFEELHDASLEIYRTLDMTLIPNVYAEGSEISHEVRDEIERLSERGVRALTEAHTETVEIISNSPQEIVLEQVVVVDVTFIDQNDVDVTEGGGRERQTIEWRLVPIGSRWVISSGTILDARKVEA